VFVLDNLILIHLYLKNHSHCPRLNFESSQLGSSDRTERCLPHFLDSERLALSRNGDALTPKEIFDDEFLNSYRHQTSSLKFFSQNSGEKNLPLKTCRSAPVVTIHTCITFGAATLRIMTFSITTLSRTTLSKTKRKITLNITDLDGNWGYADCRN